MILYGSIWFYWRFYSVLSLRVQSLYKPPSPSFSLSFSFSFSSTLHSVTTKRHNSIVNRNLVLHLTTYYLTVRYSYQPSPAMDPSECIICTEPLSLNNVFICLPCKHQNICRDCASEWFRVQRTCTLCRRPVANLPWSTAWYVGNSIFGFLKWLCWIDPKISDTNSWILF